MSQNWVGFLTHSKALQEKPHSKENDLICWRYDHCVNRSVKGINLLNGVYYSKETSLPVAFE
jgi:hypothetical protein